MKIVKEHIQNNQIKALRNRFQLLQLDIAEVFGLESTNRISKWEKGTAIPSLHNIYMLALLFNVQPQDLYPDLFKELEMFVVEQKSKLVEKKQNEAGLTARRAEFLLG